MGSSSALPPRPKGKPRRQRLKKQVTVRVEEKVLAASVQQAQGRGLTLTDAVEEALWAWLSAAQPALITREGRVLWNTIPLDMQRLTVQVWAYFVMDLPSEEDQFRRFFVSKIRRTVNEEAVIDGIQRLRALGGKPAFEAERLL